MMMNYKHQKQKGIVLIVSLIFLLLMTMIGISGIKNTVIEEKMAGNYKDRNIAFQAAEAALRDAESYLYTTITLPSFNDNTNGLYTPTTSGAARWNTNIWNDAQSIKYQTSQLTGISSPPRYIIEELDGLTESGSSLGAGNTVHSKYYRITAKAVGGTSSAHVTLQSTYKRN